jgi:hypothetical protein
MSSEIKLTDRFFVDYGQAIEKVLQRAVNHALLMHKRLGNPIAVWEDGRVVIIPPEKIIISSALPEGEAPKE